MFRLREPEDCDAITLCLTDKELEFAEAVTQKIQREAKKKRLVNLKFHPDFTDYEVGKVGVKGEMAVGKYLEVPDWKEQIWNGNEKQKGHDLICKGKTIEVKTMDNVSLQGNFIVPDWRTFTADYGIFCATDIRPNGPIVELRGWFTQEDWQKYKLIRNFGAGPREYYPWQCLREMQKDGD